MMTRDMLQYLSPRKLRVLMVDDSFIVEKAMSQWLRKRNCEVVTAGNGVLALELLKSDVTRFDVICWTFWDGITCILSSTHDAISQVIICSNSYFFQAFDVFGSVVLFPALFALFFCLLLCDIIIFFILRYHE